MEKRRERERERERERVRSYSERGETGGWREEKVERGRSGKG